MLTLLQHGEIAEVFRWVFMYVDVKEMSATVCFGRLETWRIESLHFERHDVRHSSLRGGATTCHRDHR